MKKYIVPFFCYIAIIIVLLNINTISSFLAKTIQNNKVLSISNGNEYKKNYDFIYVQNIDNYIPYSYNGVLNIIYNILNNGWDEFTFYCPEEYTDCIHDITTISKSDLELNYLNNYTHPYNSFKTIKMSITENGEITIKVGYLYNDDEIKTINKYVDKLINDLYDKNKDDYENLKAIHDYIINNTKYDVIRNDTGDSKYKSYSAYGPVVDGYATCSGYADLMAIILSKLNYENYKISTTKEEISYESNGHVWNALKIKDKWLHLDLTWDDPVASDGKDYLYHKYFLVTNDEMKEADHGNVKVEEHNFNKSVYLEFNDLKRTD